jgi:hypothetical protein
VTPENTPESTILSSEDEADLIEDLRNHGLIDEEIELLLDRDLANLSMSDLVEQHGFVTRMAAWRTHKKVIEKLKAIGWRPKTWREK